MAQITSGNQPLLVGEVVADVTSNGDACLRMVFYNLDQSNFITHFAFNDNNNPVRNWHFLPRRILEACGGNTDGLVDPPNLEEAAAFIGGLKGMRVDTHVAETREGYLRLTRLFPAKLPKPVSPKAEVPFDDPIPSFNEEKESPFLSSKKTSQYIVFAFNNCASIVRELHRIGIEGHSPKELDKSIEYLLENIRKLKESLN